MSSYIDLDDEKKNMIEDRMFEIGEIEETQNVENGIPPNKSVPIIKNNSFDENEVITYKSTVISLPPAVDGVKKALVSLTYQNLLAIFMASFIRIITCTIKYRVYVNFL
jgi:hypothetical protein